LFSFVRKLQDENEYAKYVWGTYFYLPVSSPVSPAKSE